MNPSSTCDSGPEPVAQDLVARTVHALAQRIMAGDFQPEALLPSQGQLCAHLGVSRSVVREAMRILQSRGLIDVSQGSRPRVLPASPEVVTDSLRTFVQRANISLLQLLELRRPLEAEIATLAARRITPEKLVELRAAVQALQTAPHREAQIDADVWFHRVLAEATGNPLFGIILDVLAGQLRESRRHTLAHSGVDQALDGHRRILAAVEAGDTEEAGREMLGHIQQTKRDLQATADSFPPPPTPGAQPMFGPLPRSGAGALVLAVVGLLAPAVHAAEPAEATQQIDRIIQERLAAAKVPASPLADDGEFLRRVYLDVTGRIPSHEQALAFLDSQEADKRAQLIEELLARPEYGLHFATVWRDLIVDRSADKSQVRQNYSFDFVDWLAKGFNEGRGWNALVTDLLTAAGDAKANPATTFILTNRMGVYPKAEDLAGMAGQLFMGIHIRCAQCHDHPYVRGWKQDDFWGLAAFFGQLRDHAVQADGNSKNPVYAERPNADAKKETDYLKRLQRSGLIPPAAGAEIAIPTLEDPAKTLRTVKAKFFLGAAAALPEGEAYRPQFAAWLTAPDNPYFARAAVNRLWAHFFARGLVNPVDDLRPDRAGSHPELFDLLVKEFKTAGFNYKHLIRLICQSQAYQRTSKPLPDNKEDRELLSHMAIKQLTADQTIDALAMAVGRAPATGKNRDQATALFATKEADDDPTEFSHGIPQFLYQMNAGPAGSPPANLGKLTTGKSKEDAIAGMYLTALARRPKPAEVQRLLAYLTQASDLNQGYRDVYWALLNSAEFILNR